MILSKLSKEHHGIYIICIKNPQQYRVKNLYELYKAQFEMYSASVCPLKAAGTQWIDDEPGPMKIVIEIFALYS